MAHHTIYFVRHGQTDWNVAMRYQGQMDIPINETGREQAAGNGRTLANLIDAPDQWRFIASPLGRTRETMEIIRKQFGLTAHGYETDDRLKEISDGQWEGYTHAELQAMHTRDVDIRDANKWTFRPPNGESYEMLYERVKSWLRHMEDDAIVVTHGGVLRILDHHFLGTPGLEAVHKSVPQDRVFKWDGVNAGWV